MSSRYTPAAAASAALIAAVTLAGSVRRARARSVIPRSLGPAAPVTAAFNTADITFTTGTLGLEEQAAIGQHITGHTATPELQQFLTTSAGTDRHSC